MILSSVTERLTWPDPLIMNRVPNSDNRVGDGRCNECVSSRFGDITSPRLRRFRYRKSSYAGSEVGAKRARKCFTS